MKYTVLTLMGVMAVALAAVACTVESQDDDEGSSGSGKTTGSGSSSGSGQTTGSGETTGTGETTGSGQTCASDFFCVNGSCECSTAGKEGTPCCDPDICTDDTNCDIVCEVCN